MKSLCLAAVLAGTSLGAHALGRLADVSVIDADTGTVLTPHYYQGEYWIAGAPGARYAIQIRNRTGERVLAVTAVDGVNVICGDTASWEQTGYVFAAGQGYRIDGWRKSDAEVAAFEFTAAPASYASRTGRPANVGVIGVALFRERVAQLADAEAPAEAQATAPVPAQAQRQSLDSAAAAQAPMATAGARAAPWTERQGLHDKLGTGHGERESSYVAHTDFERLQSTPSEIILIRYDSLPNLVAMGVIPQPRVWPTPSAFPNSPLARYVPDPPAPR
jgi:hypothetical protein